MNEQDVLDHLEKRLPLSQFRTNSQPERLSGGLLNHVWRVPGKPRSVIVKYAPPHIATAPDVALDQRRSMIEAQCLTAIARRGTLGGIPNDAVRPPFLFDFDAEKHILILEDCGDVLHLGDWLHESVQDVAEAGQALGLFFGRIHVNTFNKPYYAETYNNHSIQQTRVDVLYKPTRDLLIGMNLPDATELADKIDDYANKLLTQGQCLIMGDLWPPSILVQPQGKLRVLDWELAHYGRPSQDIAHLTAHLWMYHQLAPIPECATQTQEFLTEFLSAYRARLGDQFDEIFGETGLYEGNIHFGCELLMRTIGRFKSTSLYADLDPEHPLVVAALKTAIIHLRKPEVEIVWDSV